MTDYASRTIEERCADSAAMLEAMNLGVREALLRHKRLGEAVVGWEDGKVVWIQPEDIPVNEDLSIRSPGA